MVFRAFLGMYRVGLTKYPILTQSVTTSGLFVLGDAMAQHLVEGKSLQQHVWSRSVNMGFYGGCIFGPAATLWFRFLQARVVIAGAPNLTILARVAADQTAFASTNLFVFLNTMALLEGTDPKKKLESTYWNALSKNWMVWPFVQTVNFKFVPLNQRVLVVNVVSLAWNCYLSSLNSAGGDNKVLPPDA